MIDLNGFRLWLDQLPTVTTPEVQATLKRLTREFELARQAAESAAVLAAAAPYIPKPQRLPPSPSFTVQHLGPHRILTTAALHGWST